MMRQGKRWLGMFVLMSGAWAGQLCASAQMTKKLPPQPDAEDVLAMLVQRSAVIFAGEVYAIRMPQGAGNVGTLGGLPSRRVDAVDVEFRVDMGVRGTSIGNNYVLRMPLAEWQRGPAPYTLHERSMNFLSAADANGLAVPVQAEADAPGMHLGVMPIDRSNQADLTRLQRSVTRQTMTRASAPPAPGPTQAPAASASAVSGVTTQAGEETLVSGSAQGRMPELRGASVPFLALVRDVYVLTAAEGQPGSAAAAK